MKKFLLLSLITVSMAFAENCMARKCVCNTDNGKSYGSITTSPYKGYSLMCDCVS